MISNLYIQPKSQSTKPLIQAGTGAGINPTATRTNNATNSNLLFGANKQPLQGLLAAPSKKNTLSSMGNLSNANSTSALAINLPSKPLITLANNAPTSQQPQAATQQTQQPVGQQPIPQQIQQTYYPSSNVAEQVKVPTVFNQQQTGPVFPAVTQRLVSLASAPSEQFTQAQEQYQKANEQLQQLRTEAAQQGANIEGSRTNLKEAGGEQGILQRLVAGKEAALTGEMTAAQAAAATATAQQQAQQAGIGTAAGLIQPQLAGFNQQAFIPSTGQFSGSDQLNNAVSDIAQRVANNTMTYQQGLANLSGYGQAGVNALNQALGGGFNVNLSAATGASQTSQAQQAQAYISSANQARNLGTQLTQLINQAGINPNDVNAVNTLVQKISTNLSDPNYQTFQNLVNDLASVYASILTPAGGNVTDMVRSTSQSLLNAAQSGQSILQVMNNLDAQAQAKIAGVTTAFNQPNYGTNNTTNAANPWH